MKNMEVSNKIREIALKLIESPEMVDHLREDKLSIHCIIEIILYSRAPLEDKCIALQPVYAELVEYNAAQAAVPVTDEDNEWQIEYYREEEIRLNKVIQIIDFALKEITENTPTGTIFLLSGYTYGARKGANIYWDAIPFTSYEAAQKCLNDQTQEERTNFGEDNVYTECKMYTIEKWLPAGNDAMKNTVTWLVSNEGVVWFADINEDFNDELKQLTANVFYRVGSGEHSIELNRVPFKPGDIVTIDNRPDSPVCHAVIQNSPDERYDECGVQAIYFNKNGLLDSSSLKYDLMGRDICCPLFSCMLRLAKFIGELPEEEAVLYIISQAVKANPALGEDIGSYIFETENARRKQTRQNKDGDGVTWEQLQAAFGL